MDQLPADGRVGIFEKSHFFLVQFHRKEFYPGDLEQVLGECATTRTNFQQTVEGSFLQGSHDIATDILIAQKVLAQ